MLPGMGDMIKGKQEEDPAKVSRVELKELPNQIKKTENI